MFRDILMAHGLLYIEISAIDGKRIEYVKGSVEDILKVIQELDNQKISNNRECSCIGFGNNIIN